MFDNILKKYWGYDSFRPLQREIIESVVSHTDTLGILPTGGGKSITFQVPGMYFNGLTIVITPLISLMKDQVDNLRKRKIQAVYLHSGMNYKERKLANERIFNNKAKFLYISPERLENDSFLRELSRLPVNLIVVDEAHCISQWGYDFRPSYLKIKKLLKIFLDSPVLALTASATPKVQEDICDQLGFRKGYKVFRGSIERDNLSYVVRHSESKISDIFNILKKVNGSAIVYVRSRKKTKEIAEYLSNMGLSATFYHAGLDPDIKTERQQLWMEGKRPVIVATNAFGMGIDKPDVRIVLHYDMPPSLEEYYQEAGRAGRDGNQSYAVLLTAKSDKAILHRRLTMEFPDREVIRRIYTRLCVFCGLVIGEGYNKTVEFDLEKFCRTYKIDEAVVRPSLRILGQAGYAEFIEEFENSSRLMVTVDRDELYKIKISTPAHEKILTAILRTYPGLFTDYVFINEKKIAYITQIEAQVIYEKLVELSKQKIISYIPRRKSPLIFFPTAMEEERYLSIGKNIYEERKEIMRERIEAMISYGVSSEGCRLNKLMTYFGEIAEEACGHCDRCRENIKKKKPVLKEREIVNKLQKLFKTFPTGFTSAQLDQTFGKSADKAKALLRELCRDEEIELVNDKWIIK